MNEALASDCIERHGKIELYQHSIDFSLRAEICQKFSGPCEAPDLPHLDPYGNQFGSWKSIRWTRSGRRDGQKGSIQNIRHTRSEANEPERAELRRGFVGLKEGEMMTFLQA